MCPDASPPPVIPPPGSAPLHAVLAAAGSAAREGLPATLALVLETEGSTYSRSGAVAVFGPGERQLGWLSGGCLEADIAVRARAAATAGRIEWLEVDTRDDAAMLSGAALGCRGRLRLALLPLAALPGIDALLQGWCDGGLGLRWTLSMHGALSLEAGAARRAWQLPAAVPAWRDTGDWGLVTGPRAQLLLCGGGPETPPLLPLLRELGWRTTLVEARPQWRTLAPLADRHVDALAQALADDITFDAALVMHHNFERDLEALGTLAGTDVPFLGLLGPARRREDLLRLVPASLHADLRARLRAPVGLDLGGHGAQAIALSIAAQLQAWRHRAPA